MSNDQRLFCPSCHCEFEDAGELQEHTQTQHGYGGRQELWDSRVAREEYMDNVYGDHFDNQ